MQKRMDQYNEYWIPSNSPLPLNIVRLSLTEFKLQEVHCISLSKHFFAL